MALRQRAGDAAAPPPSPPPPPSESAATALPPPRPETAAPAVATGMPSSVAVFDIPALVDRIARFMTHNEVACTLRLVCKSAAAALDRPEHTLVRLSLSSPHHAFLARWGAPGAMRCLSLARRKALLRFTAASGNTANLQAALGFCGVRLDESIAKAAAAAGQLATCALLLHEHCPVGAAVAGAAAGGGSWEVCRWVLGQGVFTHFLTAAYRNDCFSRSTRTTIMLDMAAAAARSGRMEIMSWLVAHCGMAEGAPPHRQYDSPRTDLLAGAAWGCDAATLRRLHNQWIGEPVTYPNLENDPLLADMPALVDDYEDEIIIAAAGSPMPDWAAKVEYLLDVGYATPARAVEVAAAVKPDADAAARLRWLLDERRGFTVASWCALEAAAAVGNLEAMAELLAPARRRVSLAGLVMNRIAAKGQLAALQLLHESGCRFNVMQAMAEAAGAGHFHVVQWLVGLLSEAAAAPAGGAQVAAGADSCKQQAVAAGDAVEAVARLLATDKWVLPAAVLSCNRELMEWLLARGCTWSEAAFGAAAGSGSEEQLEWLVERGCPIGNEAQRAASYQRAKDNGNLGVLDCLRRLGCSEAPPPRQPAQAGRA